MSEILQEDGDLCMTFVRWHPADTRVVRVIPPLPVSEAACRSRCPVCQSQIGTEEPVALLALGPGRRPDAKAKHERGIWYSAAALVAHAACLGLPADTPR